jgi:hypothetical protein
VSSDLSKNNKTAGECELTDIFDWARGAIDEIDASSNNSKKRIVIELAGKLENVLPPEQICAEIIHQLAGRVSARRIYEVLADKYKKSTRPLKHNKKIAEPQSVIVEAGGSESMAAVDPIMQSESNEPKEAGATIPAHIYEPPVEAGELDNAKELAYKLREAEERLRLEGQTKLDLENEIARLNESNLTLQAKVVEIELGKPRFPAGPPQQMRMDQYFQQFSDIVEIAHTSSCPAGCPTWQKASTITLA